MNKVRQHPFLAALIVLTLALGIAWYWRNREPEYQGEPYSYWMAKYCLGRGSADEQKALAAFRGMGTEGVRYLARVADAPGNPRDYDRIAARARAQLNGNSLTRIFKVIWGRMVNIPPPGQGSGIDASWLRAHADQALKWLQPSLDQLGPEFTARFQSTNAESRIIALGLLASLPEAGRYEPLLLQALTNGSSSGRIRIVERICRAPKPSTNLLAAALRSLGTFTPMERSRVYFNVGLSMGPVVTNALPLFLQGLAGEREPQVRFVLAQAILQIDSAHPGARQTLVDLVSNPDYFYQAARILMTIRPSPQVPIATLIDALRSPDRDLYNAFVVTLVALAPPKAEAMAAFGEVLKSPDPHARLVAAVYLLQLEADHAAALDVLLAAARNASDPKLAVRAVFALGESRSAASAAVPELTRMLSESLPQLRSIIQDALRKIQPTPTSPP